MFFFIVLFHNLFNILLHFKYYFSVTPNKNDYRLSCNLSKSLSIHSYNRRQSQIDNLFVKSVHSTQYSIRSLSYTGPKLWNSLSIDVKKIKPFSSFRQHIKNSVIDGHNTIIDS